MSNTKTAKQKKKKSQASKQENNKYKTRKRETKQKRIVVIEFRNPLSRRNKQTNKPTPLTPRREHTWTTWTKEEHLPHLRAPSSQQQQEERTSTPLSLTTLFLFVPGRQTEVEGVVKSGGRGDFFYIFLKIQSYIIINFIKIFK